ncbi:hypothetical protein LIER_13605 [Lithospermum erythrorhizon]|uniref:Uncharacterized protein n=1 Tax=Lithospermum erythrorhizon TaxID=34254 RepID=A0AAV3Q1A2_LITER
MAVGGSPKGLGVTIVNDMVTPNQGAGKFMENLQIGHQGSRSKKGVLKATIEEKEAAARTRERTLLMP